MVSQCLWCPSAHGVPVPTVSQCPAVSQCPRCPSARGVPVPAVPKSPRRHSASGVPVQTGSLRVILIFYCPLLHPLLELLTLRASELLVLWSQCPWCPSAHGVPVPAVSWCPQCPSARGVPVPAVQLICCAIWRQVSQYLFTPNLCYY